mmetsp:Transcript_8152/g.18206  ORF Transcript_8152/g.18206 Transcript_8152/m.18206 type:complete len:414 (+) Transcript_8152:185-1426(+)|eukprot:CAMPEP_0178391770 /NCGR_PEP_ID=MMETSP0689_2-20121128/11335_1 /TAXON_ID=160604 /ORGANISM="Amphidinium massartii, Strain CS-259" /LENGTH=413 /DNA_ID=CAMNT_0020012325 /DNA_START=91 /DNA_END=1332 /DNA_ORIENTATION=+
MACPGTVAKSTFVAVDALGAAVDGALLSGRASSLSRCRRLPNGSDVSTAGSEQGSQTAGGPAASDTWSECSSGPQRRSPRVNCSQRSSYASTQSSIAENKACTVAVSRSPDATSVVRRRCRRKAYEFYLTLDKRGGQAHGIDIDYKNGKRLVVEKVNEPGLVASWNKMNPEKLIAAGSSILEVNRVKGDAAKMLEIMRKDCLLRVKVRTPESAFQEVEGVTGTMADTNSPASCPEVQEVSEKDRDEPRTEDGRATILEAIAAVREALAQIVPGEWEQEEPSDSLITLRIGELQDPDADPLLNSVAVAVEAQQAVLASIARFPSVFILARYTAPFQPLGVMSFSMSLAYLPNNKLASACLDSYSMGYCPRHPTCSLHHPEDFEVVNVQVSLVPQEATPFQVEVEPLLGYLLPAP